MKSERPTAKPFQEATIRLATRALQRKQLKRFLVADEVGLGKTVVAQQVIARLMKAKSSGPLRVFYVCSSLAIASQNRKKLLEVLRHESERELAAAKVDRLTLLPAGGQPTHPELHLYSLTPATSVPSGKGQRRDGRVEERALVQALLERAYPSFFHGHGSEGREGFFVRTAYASFPDKLEEARERVRKRGAGKLVELFKRYVRKEFGDRPQYALRRLEDPLDVIVRLRNALAAGALEDLKPDLVIFDEFQRFRDLLSDEQDEAASRVVGGLRGPSIPLLMLSATPYRLFSTRWDDTKGASHHGEFFDLVEFLYGGKESSRARRARKTCEKAFAKLNTELRRGRPDSEAAAQARHEIRRYLRKVMARTERASHPAGWNEPETMPVPAPLEPRDLQTFRHLAHSLQKDHRPSAVPYWTSIPYPMQLMKREYVAWKHSEPISARAVPKLQKSQRDRFRKPRGWAHPRSRALSHLLPPSILGRPWVRPSMPWWPLSGAWEGAEKEQVDGKLLVFSRFRAVPPAVAGLASYEVEATLLANQQISFKKARKMRTLQPTSGSESLLALFHPSPFLVRHTEPLEAKRRSVHSARQAVRTQLQCALANLEIEVSGNAAPRPMWMLLGQLDRREESFERCLTAWREVHRANQRQDQAEAGLGGLLSTWEQQTDVAIDRVSRRELKLLVDYALGAPGVVFGRALRRHWAEAVDAGFRHTLSVSWDGFRNYLDQRWLHELVKGSTSSFREGIRQAVIDGNLESVLDEHLWIISSLRSQDGEELAEGLRTALAVHGGRTNLRRPDQHPSAAIRGGFHLRSHAALPFTERQDVKDSWAGSRGTQLRADTLRDAFNSPFWPHILVTTSVGQEGLDFHVWCRSLLHWDLASNPVDLEQREGRIQRFGGLSVRRAIASDGHGLSGEALQGAEHGSSPWRLLGHLASHAESLTDASGLSPWWVCPGASIQRMVFDVPTSQQRQQLAWMKEQRMLYRLALGQPNQEDLVEVMVRSGAYEDVKRARDWMIDLSPFDFG